MFVKIRQLRLRVLGAAVAAVGLVAVLSVSHTADAAARDIKPFRGLGTWVDVYDYGPRFQNGGAVPSVTPDSVGDMARLGIKTMYLQAAQDDRRSQGDLVDRALVGDFLARAHRRGVKVVAWYLPHFADVDRDLRRVQALARFRVDGQRFDGIALDIEWTSDLPDTAARNDALVELSGRARTAAGAVPLGAIVLEPVLIEDVNRSYWPDFPWKRIRSDYDVWLPMTYWTNRTEASGWRHPERYVSENARRVRRDLGDPTARLHPIGGIADAATSRDYADFARAASQARAVGWSVYDFATTSSSAWPALRGSR